MNNNRNGKIFLAILTIVCLFIAVFGCKSPYYKISKKPPITAKDSGYLSARAAVTFPPKPPIIKQGKTITIQKRDSINYYKKVIDSLSKVKQQKLTTVKDTCKQDFEDGYTLGHSVGLFDCKTNCPPSTERVDTIYQRSQEDEYLIADLTNKNFALIKRAEKSEILDTEHKKQANQRLWYSISLLLALIVSNGVWVWNKIKGAKNV